MHRVYPQHTYQKKETFLVNIQARNYYSQTGCFVQKLSQTYLLSQFLGPSREPGSVHHSRPEVLCRVLGIHWVARQTHMCTLQGNSSLKK